jgi:hypothetical protein
VSLDVFAGLELPEEYVTQPGAVLGRRGSGKTYCALRMVEGLVAAGLPTVVMDPLGVCWGLRSSADGKGPGLPVTILGGDHGDLPLEPTAGRVVAQFVVDHPGAYVLDMGHFTSNAQQDGFARDFMVALFRAKGREKSPLHLVIDEADSFAPQRYPKGQEAMVGAAEALVRRGRSRGLGVTLISQRPAVLNKNVLTQIEVLIALQVTSPQDREALDEWAKGWSTKEQREAFLAALARLKVGEAWLWSPQWLEVFRQVQVTTRATFDSSATPKAGEQRAEPRAFADVDLDALKAEMADTIERAERDDPKRLHAEIRDLRREVAGLRAGTREPEVVFQAPDLSGVLRAGEQYVDALQEFIRVIAQIEPGLREGFLRVLAEVEKLGLPEDPPRASKPKLPRADPAERAARAATRPATPPTDPPCADDGYRPRAGARRMLESLAPYPAGLTAAQVATHSGVKRRGGTFTTYASELRRAGLIDIEGSVSSGRFSLTYAGAELVGAEGLPDDPEARRASWRERLKARGAREMFDYLVRLYPQWEGRAELAEACGLSANGGTFGTYLSRLRSNELIEEDGPLIRAHPDLFD